MRNHQTSMSFEFAWEGRCPQPAPWHRISYSSRKAGKHPSLAAWDLNVSSSGPQSVLIRNKASTFRGGDAARIQTDDVPHWQGQFERQNTTEDQQEGNCNTGRRWRYRNAPRYPKYVLETQAPLHASEEMRNSIASWFCQSSVCNITYKRGKFRSSSELEGCKTQ